MVKAKILWAHRLKTLLFVSLLLSLLLLSAALSLLRIPFLPQGFSIHFFAALSFISFLYLPPQFWPLLMAPAFFLDAVLQRPFGSHVVLMILQYGCIFVMRSSLKDYGFLSHWAVFAVSYGVIFTVLTPFDFWQTSLTILLYPLVLTWFLKILRAFKKVDHG